MAQAEPYIPSPPNYQSYTSPGTYTFKVPAKVLRIFAIVVGAGGGGGGGNSSYRGSGGGGGAAVYGWIKTTPGSELTITVGAGGHYGNAGNDGSDGGDSSIESILIAGGGKGGRGGSYSYPGDGGEVSGNTSNFIVAENGKTGPKTNSPDGTCGGDAGLGLGYGGRGGYYGAGKNGGGYGGGGGGGDKNYRGGYGANGKVIILW